MNSSSRDSKMGLMARDSRSPVDPSEKSKKIEVLKRAVKESINSEVIPRLVNLKNSILSSTSTQAAQPFVKKVKELKEDIESLKTVLPSVEKLVPPKKTSGIDPFEFFKSMMDFMVKEYQVVLQSAHDFSEYITENDVVKYATSVKQLKSKLSTN